MTDAVISTSHLILKHLKTSHSYARDLFADFSSAFDTVQPQIVVRKLIDLNVHALLLNWFHSFLTDRSQQV